MYNDLIRFIRDLWHTSGDIGLHDSTLIGREKEYLADVVESTVVSSIGQYVDKFESGIQDFTLAPGAVATVNGSAAIHTALMLAGVRQGDLVITQALTFVAGVNVMQHMGARPVFIDVSPNSLGLCPSALRDWLADNAAVDDSGVCRHRASGRTIRAAMPMHTFGHPMEMEELLAVCAIWGIAVLEDAAQSLGSLYGGRHTGTLGDYGVLSFNGNKVITTGGGGAILCSSESARDRAKFITTNAKRRHRWDYYHEEPGFNYRMPNLNAALGCAQIEYLRHFLHCKRLLACRYREYLADTPLTFQDEPSWGKSNFWLIAVLCPDVASRDALLRETNNAGVTTRPVWQPMHRLPMYESDLRDGLEITEYLAESLVNLPSGILSHLADD